VNDPGRLRSGQSVGNIGHPPQGATEVTRPWEIPNKICVIGKYAPQDRRAASGLHGDDDHGGRLDATIVQRFSGSPDPLVMFVRDGLQHPDLYLIGDLPRGNVLLEAMRFGPALRSPVMGFESGARTAQQPQGTRFDLNQRGCRGVISSITQVARGVLSEGAGPGQLVPR
jgi:hypothetical protein